MPTTTGTTPNRRVEEPVFDWRTRSARVVSVAGGRSERAKRRRSASTDRLLLPRMDMAHRPTPGEEAAQEKITVVLLASPERGARSEAA
jgi:hypothetical protein